MHLGPIGGYFITTGGYGAPLTQHRESSGLIIAMLKAMVSEGRIWKKSSLVGFRTY